MSEGIVDKYNALSDYVLNEEVESVSRLGENRLYLNLKSGRTLMIEADGEAIILDGKIFVHNKLKVELQV